MSPLLELNNQAANVCSNISSIYEFLTTNSNIRTTIHQAISSLGTKFLHNLVEQNIHIAKEWPHIWQHLTSAYSPIIWFFSYVLYTILCYLCRHGNLSRSGFIIIEIIAFGGTLLPLSYPYQSLRFVFGLTSFMHFLVVHSIVCEKLQVKLKGTASEANLIEQEKASVSVSNKSIRLQTSEVFENNASKVTSSLANSSKLQSSLIKSENLKSKTSNDKNTFIAHTNDKKEYSFLKNILYSYYESCLCIRNLQLHQPRDAPSFSLKRLCYLTYVALLTDSCMYLIREWIPVSISPENKLFASTLVGGLWVLTSMDFVYSCFILQSAVLGKPLPYVYRHRHPFISSSLSEFWGVRWNPLIGKALQDAFYKPIRRLGGSRALAMVICFIGSAYLHAHPQYISTHNIMDVLRMSGFFIAQGLLVPMELLVVKSAGLDIYFQKYLLPKSGSVYTSARYQWLVELLTVLSILSTAYVVFEVKPSLLSVSFYQTVGGALWLIIVTMTVVSYCLFQYSILAHLNKQVSNNGNGNGARSQIKSDIHNIHNIHDNSFDSVLSHSQMLSIVLGKLIGWIWCISWILYLLPNFTLPVIHAILDMYPRSFVVGAMMKSILN